MQEFIIKNVLWAKPSRPEPLLVWGQVEPLHLKFLATPLAIMVKKCHFQTPYIPLNV